MKQNMKNQLKNPWILALCIFLIAVTINAIAYLIRPGMESVTRTASLIAGCIVVGGIYTNAFKEKIPKRLRFKTAVNYVIIESVILLLILWLTGDFDLILIGIFAVVIAAYSLLIYFMIGLGSKIQLKAIEKNETNRKRNNQTS